MDGSASTHALSAGALSFTPFAAAAAAQSAVPDAGNQWMPGAHIPQPHVYAEHDATDAFGFAALGQHEPHSGYHYGHRNGHGGGHGRRWSQPNADQYGRFGQQVAAPQYDVAVYAPQYQGQMHYHMSPPSSPPNTPDLQVNTPPPISLSDRSRHRSRSGAARRNSSPELGRKATSPSGQRIYLLPKAVNSELMHHGVQLDEDFAASQRC